MTTLEQPLKIRVIYSNDINHLLKPDCDKIQRVSYVEPQGIDWFADLSMVGGPKLGPFATRQLAIDAELEYLNNHLSTLTLKED